MDDKIVVKRSAKKTFSVVLHNVLIAIFAFIWLIPIIWLVASSLSDYTGMNTSRFFPEKWSIKNYKALLFETDSVANFPAWFMNTLIVAIFTCIISTIFVVMVSYAMSCMRFKGRRAMMNLSVMFNLFPGVLSMIAIYFVLKMLGLTNSHLGLILAYSGASGLGYLICKGFFDTVPQSLRDAAKIDGASEARTFTSIVLPISRPIIVYTVISSFMVPWMDFVMAKIILNEGISKKWTVAIGLYKMVEKEKINDYFTQFCAGGVLVSVPISILFFIMQKCYVEGITGGAVKG